MFIVLDLETTGLDYNTEQITEIAAICLNNDLQVVGTFQRYVKLTEGRVLSDFIKNLTGFTEEFLAGNGIDEEKAVDDLKAFFMEHFVDEITVVAHHAPFDFSFLSKFGFNPLNFICTRVLSRLVDPNEKASLADVAKRLGIDNSAHHQAMNDVEVTCQVLATLAPIAAERGISFRNVVIDSAERPLNYIPLHSQVLVF
jgi:DNA polymerase III epsilon subunit-like protein